MSVNDPLPCWISSFGGPFIVLPAKLLHDWEGILPPSKGRSIKAVFRWDSTKINPVATDYDRACDVKGYIKTVPVGSGHCIVLGSHPMLTTLLLNSDSRVATIVRVRYADDFDSVLTRVVKVSDNAWKSEGITFNMPSDDAYVMDATISGREISRFEDCKNYHMFPLLKGQYRLDTAVYEPDDETSIVLHRLSSSTK